MTDGSSSICFIVRGAYAATTTLEKEPPKKTIETSDGSEVTLDEYASYMSETHIANLGGKYQENLSGDKSVNLVAIIPGDHVYSTGQDLKVLPLQAAVR